MSKFLSDKFKTLKPYVPGEQPRGREGGYIKLNTNESPFPPSPAVLEAVSFAQIASLNLYSDPTATELLEAASDYYGVEKSNIFVSNGSDEALAFAFYAFNTGKTVAFPDITYGFYPVYCDLFGIDYKTIPLDENFKINIGDYTSLSGKYNIVIANPNAQVGCLLKVSEIEEIVASRADRIVVVDEAYIDFGGESCVPLTKKYKNLLCIQTMSKSRNLAGARVGVAIGDAALIADLNMIKYSFNPYNLNTLSIKAGAAAFSDRKYLARTTAEIIRVREQTREELENMGFFVTASAANFLFAKSPDIGGRELYLRLKEEKGILVRNFGEERIKDFVRITIGSAEQMKKLIAAIRDIISGVRYEQK